MYNITTAVKLGGIETYCWEVSLQLIKNGNNVELISGNGTHIKYSDIPIKQFEYTPRSNIINLGNRYKKWGERVSFFKNAYPYLKKQKYDVLILHKPLDFFVAFFLRKLNPALKTVLVSGGEDFYGFDKFFVKYVDKLISVSKDNRSKIKQRYLRDVSVIPNGVNVNKFHPDEDSKIHLRGKYLLQDKHVLVSVGRVVKLKGFQVVIESLQSLNSNFVYVLIGDGEYLPTLKELSSKLGVSDRVFFLGSVENSNLPQLLNIGDIYIQPTVGNEAFGITIIEAMACGLPVVASNNGGIVDIITDGKNGLLFETGNINKLEDRIKYCLKNKERLSQASKKHVRNYFSLELSTSMLINEIQSIGD